MTDQITSPIKAIRAKCIDCYGGQSSEVKLCPSIKCPLYPFRMGKNPFRAKREYTDEQRATMAERLSKIRRQKQGENLNDFEGYEVIDKVFRLSKTLAICLEKLKSERHKALPTFGRAFDYRATIERL